MSKRKKKHRLGPEMPPVNRSVLATAFGAVLCLYLLGTLLPGRLTWGFSYWSLLSPSIALPAFAVAAVLLLPSVADRVTAALNLPARFLSTLFGRIGRPLSVIVISAAVTLVLFYWRSRALVYGDGFAILDDVSSGGEVVLFDQYYFQILTVYLNHYAYQLLASLGGLQPAEIMGLINALGGLVGLWAVYSISSQLSTDRITRAFIVIGSLSSATVILFFGWVENYTWAFAVGLWALSFSIGYVRRRNGAAVMLVFAVAAAFLHMITLPIVLVTVLALLMRHRPGGNYVAGVPLRYINAGLVAVSFGLVALARAFDMYMFVPFAPSSGNPYAFLTGDHLLDIINQVIQAAPLGLTLGILSILYARKRGVAASAEDGILATASLVFFLAAFWIDPEIGAPRDWDLLSFFGLPLTIWGLSRFAKLFPQRQVARAWLVAAGVIVVMSIGPNVYEKNNPEVALARLDDLLNVDPHYQASYREAARCIPWSVALQEEMGEMRRPMKYLKRILMACPDDHNALYNLGSSYYYLGIPDSAYMCWRQGASLQPDDVKTLVALSAVIHRLGNCDEATVWAERALKYDPTNVEALTRLGIGHLDCQRGGEALVAFRRAYQLAPTRYEQVVHLAMCHAMTGTADSGLVYYTRALPMAPPERRSGVYSSLVSLCLDLGRLEEAGRYLNALRQLNPGSPDIPGFTARLNEAGKR